MSAKPDNQIEVFSARFVPRRGLSNTNPAKRMQHVTVTITAFRQAARGGRGPISPRNRFGGASRSSPARGL